MAPALLGTQTMCSGLSEDPSLGQAVSLNPPEVKRLVVPLSSSAANSPMALGQSLPH